MLALDLKLPIGLSVAPSATTKFSLSVNLNSNAAVGSARAPATTASGSVSAGRLRKAMLRPTESMIGKTNPQNRTSGSR